MAEHEPDPDEAGQDDAPAPRRRLGEDSHLPAFLRDLLRSRPSVAEDVDHETLDADDREVVDALVEFGLGYDYAVDAVVTGRVPLALARHHRSEQDRYTVEEVAERSGVPAAVLRQVHTAMGLPPRERYTRNDLQWAKEARRFLDHMPAEALIRSARVRGTAMAAVARSDIQTIREQLLLPMRQAGADDLTLAVALAEATKALEDLATSALVRTYELQLDHQMSTELVNMAARSASDEVTIAVGFVDVEGYTALSARVDGAGLDTVIDAFERRVIEVTSTDPEASPVKYLGDAVMLVSSDVHRLAHAMFELTQPVEALADAPLKGGMSAGPVIVREGDFFGSPVNLAARLTDQARAWSVLVDEEVGPELADDFRTVQVRPLRLRGVGTRRPTVLQARLADEADVDDAVGDVAAGAAVGDGDE